VSEPTATATPSSTAKKPAGKKYLGLSRNQAIGVGAVFVGALAYILWRRHQAAKTTATASTATSTSTSTASELAALEDALEQLQAQGYGGTAGGSGAVGTVGSGGGVSTGTGTATSGSTGTQPSAPSTVTGAPATSGGGTPITVTPVNLHTTQVSATSVGVAWVAPTIPAGQGPLTGYGCEVYTADGQSEGPSWTVPKTQLYANAGGLKSKTTYHLNVWCLPAKTGGPHASVSFTTKS